MTKPEMLGVTVVVPTLNRDGFLYNCLLDLLAQQHYPLEILVVDQSDSTPDDVLQLVIENPDVISYHIVSFRGLPRARNYGWRRARYEAIVYVDDDVRCSPDLVSEHLRALQFPNVGAAAGRIDEKGHAVDPRKRSGRFRYWIASPERGFADSGEYEIDHVPGGNFSTWKTIARQVGGFDEGLDVGAALYEETDYSLRVTRAGYRVYYNGKACLEHLAAPAGGCRVDEVESYVWALAHNRTVLIRRHLRWFQKPTAYAELLRLGLAYAVAYRQPRALRALFSGIEEGYRRQDMAATKAKRAAK